jgi:hypothetical protein
VKEGEGKQETRKVECRQENNKVVIRWEEGDRRQEKGDADWGWRKKKEGGSWEKRD